MKPINDSDFEQISQEIPPDTRDQLRVACQFAFQAHDGIVRSSQRSFFEHVLNTAKYISEWTHDPALTIAASLHDILDVQNTGNIFSPGIITAQLGEEVAILVRAYHQLGQAQERNLFWGVAEWETEFPVTVQLQALLIKLASGLDLAGELEALTNTEKRSQRGQMLLSKYAPLASQLGMWEYKRKLEDICLKAIAPVEFRILNLHQTELFEKNYQKLDELRHAIAASCRKQGLQVSVKLHRRHIYSLYQMVSGKWSTEFETLVKSALNLDQLVRFSVIAPNLKSCYQAVGSIHEIGYPVHVAWRDFLAQPKPNGYAALHTAIQVGKQRGVQYRINLRTPIATEISEQGILFAPHRKLWLLDRERALGGLSKQDGGLRGASTLLETLLQREHPSTLNRIRVFTPHGKGLNLPRGATPIDFAYAVHTQLGHKFDHALVNHTLVDDHYRLNEGDVVEIYTQNNAVPQIGWLNWVVTEQARKKISHWLKTAPRAIGEARIRQAVQEHKLDPTTPEIRNRITSYAQKRGFNLETLFEQVGSGSLDIDPILNEIFNNAHPMMQTRVLLSREMPGTLRGKHLWIKLAACCSPDFPDEITGCLRGRQVIVHQSQCPNAVRAKQHLSVQWQKDSPPSIPITLKILATDRAGLLSDLTGVIANHFYNMKEFWATSHANGNAEIRFSLELPTPAVPEILYNELNSVDGVTDLILSEETKEYLRKKPHLARREAYLASGDHTNPYSPGRPIFDRAMFFGRRQEVQALIRYLTPASQPTSILLCAQRRSGKTSLGLRLKDDPRILQEYLPVFLDISASTKDSDTILLRKISQHIQYRLREQDLSFESANLEANPADAYLKFEQNLEAFYQQTHKRILLIIDEFGAALEAFRTGVLSAEFFIRLRSWSQLAPITFLVIGGQRLAVEIAQSFPEFSNVFLPQPLGRLREFDAIGLIRQPVLHRLVYDDNVIQRILGLTSNYPYYIHLICARLFNHASEAFQARITLEKVEQVRLELAEALARAHYAHLWKNDSLDQAIVLTALANTGNENIWTTPGQLSTLCEGLKVENALRELYELETLEKRLAGNSFEYQIRLPLFTGWILNNWSLPNLLLKRQNDGNHP